MIVFKIYIFALLCILYAGQANSEEFIWQRADFEKHYLGNGSSTSKPNPVQIEPSTFNSIGIRWPIQGDSNANAKINVKFRDIKDSKFHDALPLFRTIPKKNSPENRVENGWLFAGSIFNLSPGKVYEIKLMLLDPDGGSTEKLIQIPTKKPIAIPKNKRIFHVYPKDSSKNSRVNHLNKDNMILGLDIVNSKARPGDTFLLHAGTYRVGEWQITKSGTKENPIIFQSSGNDEVILDGLGNSRLISADALKYVRFYGLTFKNADYLFVGHNGSDLVIQNCKFEISKVGFTSINGGYKVSRGTVITDNYFIGPTKWPRTKGIESIKGVEITGAGHIVAYNYFSKLGDAIHGTQHGQLSASDIHNNEIYICTDDGIESDYADTNVRIYNNRITNTFSGVSAQPVNGGPVYIFNNSIFNPQYSPFKLHNHTSGVLLFNNTSISYDIAFHIQNSGESVSNVLTRNNLFIGRKNYGLRSTGNMIACDFDNDGYGGFNGLFGSFFAEWNNEEYAKPKHTLGSAQLYTNFGAKKVDPKKVFHAGDIRPKHYANVFTIENHATQLSPDSNAIDSGIHLPNLLNNISGNSPDLGCCEFNHPLPQYGPRSAHH